MILATWRLQATQSGKRLPQQDCKLFLLLGETKFINRNESLLTRELFLCLLFMQKKKKKYQYSVHKSLYTYIYVGLGQQKSIMPKRSLKMYAFATFKLGYISSTCIEPYMPS